MTDDEINVAIAEACGWTEIQNDPDWGWLGKPPKFKNNRWPLFDYCEDLNTMHEAEVTMDEQQYGRFSAHLYDAECERQKQTKKWRWLSATARQRAEAFLRTLGRWKE